MFLTNNSFDMLVKTNFFTIRSTFSGINLNNDNKDEIISKYNMTTTSTLAIEIKGNVTSSLTVDDSGDLITYTDHNKKEISV